MTELGRIISAGIQEFRASCTNGKETLPVLGGLVWAKMGEDGKIYAVVKNLTISEDGLIAQIARSIEMDPSLLWDNRRNRTIAVVINAVVVGFSVEKDYQHRIPSHPSAVLEIVESCSMEDAAAFCTSSNYDYLRFLMPQYDVPRFDLLAAHFSWLQHTLSKEITKKWKDSAIRKLHSLLQDDPDCYLRLVEFLYHLERLPS